MSTNLSPNYTTHAKRLSEFIQSNPDSPRIETSAFAVQMFLNGYKHERFREPRYKFRVHQQMDLLANCCVLIKTGIPWSVGYLEAQQRQAVITWLQTKTTGTSPNCGMCNRSTMVFDSKQSYYSLFEEVGLALLCHSRQRKSKIRVSQEYQN